MSLIAKEVGINVEGAAKAVKSINVKGGINEEVVIFLEMWRGKKFFANRNL